jgi:mitochondrial ribonuclease P protein 3
MLSESQQEERIRCWNHLKQYIIRRNQTNPIDIVIDGANVGYYDTNYPGAPKHVCYEQIQSLVQHFMIHEKKSILVVIHTRHFDKNKVPQTYQPLIQSWIQLGILYKTPHGMNDDWFWFHAVLLSGHQTMIITNDEMRDHQFQMLAPRSFLRWKERHQIKFTFGEWKNKKVQEEGGFRHRDVILQYPDCYTRRIQQLHHSENEDGDGGGGFVIPHPKRGDTNRFLDGTFDANDHEPIEETYVCIYPQMNKEKKKEIKKEKKKEKRKENKKRKRNK